MAAHSVTTYTGLQKSLHWLMGLMIIALLVVGVIMEDMAPSATKWQLYDWHKAAGIIVLGLFLVRLLVRVRRGAPGLSEHPKWQRLAAGVTHIALYLLMLAMPVSGWIMSMAGGHSVHVLGFELPMLIEKNKELGATANQLHSLFSDALILLLVVHIGAALAHHFYFKDNVLTRMLPKRRKKSVEIPS